MLLGIGLIPAKMCALRYMIDCCQIDYFYFIQKIFKTVKDVIEQRNM